MTSGTAGAAVKVGVAETAGVAVNANAVTASVAVFSGAMVSVGVTCGVEDFDSKRASDGNSNCAGRPKIRMPMPATMNMARNENARRARVVFCSRLRKLMERLDSWRARMPMM